MKKFLILCVVLAARIHAESELDEDSENYDSDEDSYDPRYVVEAQHQQEVETEDEDYETRYFELDEDSEDYDSDEDSYDPQYVAEAIEAEHQQEVETEEENNEFVSHLPMEYDLVVDACRMETGYTGEVFAEEEASYFSENRGLKKFNHCFLEKTGFVTRDGKLNVPDALDRLAPIYTKDILEYCIGRKKTFFFHVCYSEVKHHNNKQLLLIKYVVQFINQQFTQIVNVCRMETGYTDEVIAEEEKSNLNKDAGLKKFNKCFLEKTGFRTNELFNIDTVLQGIPQSNVTKIVEHCQSLTTKKIIPDSVPFFSGCLHLGVSEYVRKYSFKHVIQEESDQVRDMVYDCQRQTGFTQDVIKKSFTDNNFTGDVRLRKFNDCFLEKTGFITSYGKLNIDAALAKLPHRFAKPVIQICQAKIILKHTTESVRHFSTCYHHGVQDYISVTQRSGFTAFLTSFVLYVSGTSFDKILTF